MKKIFGGILTLAFLVALVRLLLIAFIVIAIAWGISELITHPF
jgi:hypothetical protein